MYASRSKEHKKPREESLLASFSMQLLTSRSVDLENLRMPTRFSARSFGPSVEAQFALERASFH